MAIHKLGLDTVNQVADGTIVEAFNVHVKRAVQDISDRPGDKKARKVVLTMELTPVLQANGLADNVAMEVKIKSSIPDHVSRTVEAAIKRNGTALFNDMSPDNPDQMTLDQVSSDD